MPSFKLTKLLLLDSTWTPWKNLQQKPADPCVKYSLPQILPHLHTCYRNSFGCPARRLLFTCVGHVWACSHLTAPAFSRHTRLAPYPGFNGFPLQFIQILSQKSLHIPSEIDFNRDRQTHVSGLRVQNSDHLRRYRPIRSLLPSTVFSCLHRQLRLEKYDDVFCACADRPSRESVAFRCRHL